MSVMPDYEPVCTHSGAAAIDLVIDARPRDLGSFSVRRMLPSALRRMVGPFIFFDHMGPAEFGPGEGINVRPHPHIGLATITYLFEGAIAHRDSLGSEQIIRPGDVNWMIAGRGIVHSERVPPEARAHGGRMHGIQTWVALPKAEEEIAPQFDHHTASAIPIVEKPGVTLHVIAGTAYGATSPTRVLSPTLYVHAVLETGAELLVDEEHAERALYIVDGDFEVNDRECEQGTMVVLQPQARVLVRARRGGRLMLLGGAPLDGPREIWWNFVSSSAARIEQAKADWREGRYPKVPGDEKEFIPLPEG
jgi:redox-sensitive bicupin YhaK (pirin superfamily)